MTTPNERQTHAPSGRKKKTVYMIRHETQQKSLIAPVNNLVQNSSIENWTCNRNKTKTATIAQSTDRWTNRNAFRIYMRFNAQCANIDKMKPEIKKTPN